MKFFFTFFSAFAILETATSIAVDPPSSTESSYIVPPNTFLPIKRDIFLEKRAEFVAREDYQTTEGKLRLLLEEMMFFVRPMKFHWKEFSEISAELKKRLSDVTVMVMSMDPIEEALFAQLTYVERIFDEMLMTRAYLELIPISEGKDCRILSCLYQFKICLFVLRNEFGVPNSQIDSYTSDLRSFIMMFEDWKAEFERLGVSSAPLQSMYSRVTEGITDIITELECYIPRQVIR